MKKSQALDLQETLHARNLAPARSSDDYIVDRHNKGAVKQK